MRCASEPDLRLLGALPRATVCDLVGNTPLLEVRIFDNLAPHLCVLLKAEFLNPGGSVKDRAALSMLRSGLKAGQLTPGKIIMDSTSGNTGVAYAMLGAALGYPVRLVVPANISRERQQLIRAYGAELVLSDPQEGSDGAIRLCREMVEHDPERYFYPDQYNNPANWRAHYEGTGPEIWEQTGGEVTHFVAGLGTSGTFMGTSLRLKEFSRDVVCVSLEPDDPFHGLEGLKHMASSIVPGIYRPEIADQHLMGPTEAAYDLVRRIAHEQGILVGHSTGLALWGVSQLIHNGLREGVVVLIAPDGGARYLSEGVYSDLGAS